MKHLLKKISFHVALFLALALYFRRQKMGIEMERKREREREREREKEREVEDGRIEVDYDVVIIPALNPLEIKVQAINLEKLKKLLRKYPVRSLATFGDHNAGKTFILGALFNLRFIKEKMTLSTYGLSFYLVESPDGSFLLMDFEGTNSSIACNEANMRERFSQEYLLEKIGMIYGYHFIYVMSSFSCENVKKIMALRKRAFKEKKELIIVLNWKEAKTLEEIEDLKEMEIIKSFEGNDMDKKETHVIVHQKVEEFSLSELSVYFLGSNKSRETHAFNQKVFEAIRRHISGGSFKSDNVVRKILMGLGITNVFGEVPEENNETAYTNEHGSQISKGELLDSLYDNFSTDEVQIQSIEKGEEDNGNLPFKTFVRMSPKENANFQQKVEIRANDQNIYASFDIFEVETHDIFPEKSNTRNFVSILSAPGFTSGRCVSLKDVPTVNNFPSNTFTFSSINSGYKVVLYAKRSDEGLRKGTERKKGLIKYAAEYYSTITKYQIIACDFKYGMIYLWFVACGEDGKFIEESLECVQNRRKEYFEEKETGIPNNFKTNFEPIFLCDQLKQKKNT